MRKTLTAILIWPGAALAWEPLTGPGIEAALTGRTLVYDAHTAQTFHEGGTTDYLTERLSTGRWEVRGDRYCSAWPPSETWTCYAVEAEPGAIRFVPEAGAASVGRYPE